MEPLRAALIRRVVPPTNDVHDDERIFGIVFRRRVILVFLVAFRGGGVGQHHIDAVILELMCQVEPVVVGRFHTSEDVEHGMRHL